MIEVSNFKKGICIDYKGAPMIIVDVTFSTPTARGGNTIAKTKLRNLLTGAILDDTFRSGEKFAPAALEEKEMQYLYEQDEMYYFMDNETYEQIPMNDEQFGDA